MQSYGKPPTCFGYFRPSSQIYSTKKKKTQNWLIMTWMCNCRFSKRKLKCLLLFGAESFVFQFAIQNSKDQDIQNYNFARCPVWV